MQHSLSMVTIIFTFILCLSTRPSKIRYLVPTEFNIENYVKTTQLRYALYDSCMSQVCILFPFHCLHAYIISHWTVPATAKTNNQTQQGRTNDKNQARIQPLVLEKRLLLVWALVRLLLVGEKEKKSPIITYWRRANTFSKKFLWSPLPRRDFCCWWRVFLSERVRFTSAGTWRHFKRWFGMWE